MINISMSQYLVGKLRQAVISGDIIDFNSISRNGTNYIFPDSPMITKLMGNKNNFPRISLESVSQSSDHRLGQMSDSYLMRETIKITCFSVRDLICSIKTTSDESIEYDPLIDTYELDNIPFSKITMVPGTLTGSSHTFVNGIDYVQYDSNFDGFFDSIKWLGNDVPDDATNFLVSYKRVGTAQEIVRIMIQNINEFFRTSWRLGWSENKIFNYKLISSNSVDFDESGGLYRFEMVIQFSSFDGMESV